MLRATKILSWAACLGVWLASATAWSQAYRFHVSRLELQAYVLPEGAARLQYAIVFENQPGAHPIDVVDVGLPHGNYSISNMSASLDGQKLTTIRPSEYISLGVEVHLGGSAIGAGQKGEFRFECVMPDMVYQDTTARGRASLQIKPTWFDPSLQVGRTQLRVAAHLLPGIKPEEVTYHREGMHYDNLVLIGEGEQKHVVAVWERPNHLLTASNPKFGVSFPQRGLTHVVRVTAFGLFLKWFRESLQVQLVSGICVVAGLAWLFFRFSGGTGCVVFVILAALSIVIMIISPGAHLLLWPLGIALIALNEWRRARRGEHYLPAMATVEGGGIKRGLTAPQAAVLLELPLSRILCLVLFGLLKKGVLRQVSADPLTVEVVPEYRVTRQTRRKRMAEKGAITHNYEHPFIDLLSSKSGPVQEHDFSEAVGKLVKDAARAMKGFDLSDTQEYYRSIVAKAWAEAESIGEIQQRTQVVDRHFEWMMMDGRWDDRFRQWSRSGYNYYPSWTRSSVGGGAAASGRAGPPAAQTSFGEVASSFVGWAENAAARLAGSIEPASMGIQLPARSAVDLSAIDKVTANVFEALAESSSSGGGGGGGEEGVLALAPVALVPAPAQEEEGEHRDSTAMNPQQPRRELAAAQARWLLGARMRLLRRCNIVQRKRILDLGAGWGDVAEELHRRCSGWVIALDCRLPAPAAGPSRPRGSSERPIHWLAARAEQLPLPDGSCDLVFAQCLFLWLRRPRQVIQEACRVLQRGGFLAAVEPDYGGLMEYPPRTALRPLWLEALRCHGADPLAGRKLAHRLAQAGLQVEVRLLDRLEPPAPERFELLAELPLSDRQRRSLQQAREAARRAGPACIAHLPFWLVLAQKPPS